MKSQTLPHSKVRTIAADKYLIAANQKKVNFDAKLIKTTTYGPRHTVGLQRIDEVDRTNTDPRLLPCKVVKVQTEGH